MFARSRKSITALAAVAIVKCSTGTDVSTSPRPDPRMTPMAGYWKGAVTDPSSSQLRAATLFADDAGEVQLLVSVLPPNFQGGAFASTQSPFVLSANVGDACCAAEIELPATLKNLTETTQTSTRVTFDVQPGKVTGTFDLASKRMTFELTRVDVSPLRLSMTDLSGTYTGTYASFVDRPKSWTMTIQNTGTVTGSDEYGCTWLGTAAVTNTSRNLFRMKISADGCTAVRLAPPNGEYVGLGILDANRTASRYPGQETVAFSLLGPIWLGEQTLAR